MINLKRWLAITLACACMNSTAFAKEFPSEAKNQEVILTESTDTSEKVALSYRSLLSTSGQAAYDKLYAAAISFNESLIQFDSPVDIEELSNITDALTFDHPELYWIDPLRCLYVTNQDNQIVSVSLNYLLSQTQVAEVNDAYLNQLTTVVSSAANANDELTKEENIYDAICSITTYATNEYDQSSYSIYVEGESVCAGYAASLKVALDSVGIENYIVTGTATSSSSTVAHAWNIVKVNGKYYAVDITWDDNLEDFYGIYYHRYFNQDPINIAEHTLNQTSQTLVMELLASE